MIHSNPTYKIPITQSPTNLKCQFSEKRIAETFYSLILTVLSKYARIPPSFAGGMNGLPSPLGGISANL
ncbi:MAG: hypothetical protein WCO26_23560, partial [Deltaproteobacteria bacterium]